MEVIMPPKYEIKKAELQQDAIHHKSPAVNNQLVKQKLLHPQKFSLTSPLQKKLT